MARGKKTGGRAKGVPNKATSGLKAYAQTFSEEAVNMLVAVMRADTAHLGARVMAAKEILDRGHGKPPQALTGPDGDPITVPQAITFVLRQAPNSDNRH